MPSACQNPFRSTGKVLLTKVQASDWGTTLDCLCSFWELVTSMSSQTVNTNPFSQTDVCCDFSLELI